MPRSCLRVLATGAALLVVTGAAGMNPGALRLLHDGLYQEWEQRDFSGSTRYDTHILDGEPVLRARSSGDASGLYRTRSVALARRSVLNWRWRVQAALDNPWETSREADDFAARVYVVAAHPFVFWRSRAICYVWASSMPVGASWQSPYSGSIKMVALRSGSTAGGRWVSESVDVAADFLRLFGEAPERIHAVAIMTDTDNTGLSATAWYDDVRWTQSPAPDPAG